MDQMANVDLITLKDCPAFFKIKMNQPTNIAHRSTPKRRCLGSSGDQSHKADRNS
jgi:hypothetical protein